MHPQRRVQKLSSTHGMMMVDMDMLYVGVHLGRHGPSHGLGPYCADTNGTTMHTTTATNMAAISHTV